MMFSSLNPSIAFYSLRIKSKLFTVTYKTLNHLAPYHLTSSYATFTLLRTQEVAISSLYKLLQGIEKKEKSATV